MILVLGVALFTSRVILNALGVNDYGLYNVIGGVVAMFTVISGSLTVAISRYITFEIGKGNHEDLKKIFSTAVFIQLCLCLIILIGGIPIGFWFINHKMQIVESQFYAANWVFAFSLLSFSINLLTVPFTASIIAHERMNVFALISIVDVVFKLIIAYVIMILPTNKLIWYAFMIFIVNFFVQSIYVFYCIRHFSYCKTKPKYTPSIFKEMSGFAGWNFIGSSSAILRNQGNNVILNLFFGTAVNAAYGIGMQVSNAASQLSDNFMMAVNPQITKYYAQNNWNEMHRLIYRSSKLSFCLILLISLAIITNTNYILEIWLKTVPPYTNVFVNLVLMFILSESISKPLITAMLATGNIKNYQLIVGGFQMLNLPISYLLLLFGGEPTYTLITALIISQICFFARIIMLRKMIKLRVIDFIKEVYLRCIIVFVGAMLIPVVLKFFIPDVSFSIFILETFITILWTSIVILFIGFKDSERKIVFSKIPVLKSLYG